MNRAQKIAWSCLILISTGLLTSVAVIIALYPKLDMPAGLRGFGCIGLGGLGALSALVFRKDGREVPFDERGRLFHQRAWFAGYRASCLFFAVVGMTTWFMYGANGTISVNVLPFTVVGGLMTLTLVHSLVILELAGQAKEKNHEPGAEKSMVHFGRLHAECDDRRRDCGRAADE